MFAAIATLKMIVESHGLIVESHGLKVTRDSVAQTVLMAEGYAFLFN